MKFKNSFNNQYLIIAIITFVTTILIISSSMEVSFAKKDNDNDNNKVDDKDREFKKHTSISIIDKKKDKTLDDNLKEPNEQEITLSPRYPDQFFVCGYPQQVITDYNSLEKNNNCS